ncbi:hypothetical protein SAMN05428945_5434 [Streptomyces sp. 2224.1]|nr:hypothetical protein SAMN05428945_5434 [Streptomyces sp. 2224.1]
MRGELTPFDAEPNHSGALSFRGFLPQGSDPDPGMHRARVCAEPVPPQQMTGAAFPGGGDPRERRLLCRAGSSYWGLKERIW